MHAAEEPDRELKLAMSHLAKSLGKVLRAAHPGKHFRGAFRTLDRAKPGGLEVAFDSERMFVRAGRFEIELHPYLTPEAEDELLYELKSRQSVRRWREPLEPRRR